ncbi:MAG: hypothetical protein HQK91_13615 [Nitrospirae bacterium]|nr:hypothetical protein [Nitrospirota bacterium]MBF0542475.1 hypothetical protein [Nitrospirota bacterium]
MKRFTVFTTVFALTAFLVFGSISFAADEAKPMDDKGAAVATTPAPDAKAEAKPAKKGHKHHKKAAKKAEKAEEAAPAPEAK